MNTNDAKRILLAYRPGTADAEDADTAAALELARQDAGLARWLEVHCARQQVIHDKFQQIKPPPGLKEQILSEHAATHRPMVRPTSGVLVGVMAIMAILIAVVLAHSVLSEKALTSYRNRMASQALRSYSMDLTTSDAPKIHDYLKQQGAPADYTLPPGLAKTALVGCATQKWQGAKVSMICFRTGRPLAPGAQSDLWLFVIDRGSLRNAPEPGPPSFVQVNKLITATWTSDNKTYFLGVEGDEAYLRTFL